MSAPFFTIDLLSLFSADRKVYRAFDHMIVARFGTLLLVPEMMVIGWCGQHSDPIHVVNECPVPPEEVYAVLEYPAGHPVINQSEWDISDHVQQMQYLGIDPAACAMDYITPMVKGEEKVLRLVHPSGVRYAVVMP